MAPEQGNGMKRVLVAEDEPAIASLIVWNLERIGFLVEVARDGAWAERRLEAASPDVLVLDLLLPLRSGWQVLRRLRRTGSPTQSLPVVVVSALASPRLRIELAEASVDDVLGKPFSVSELCAVVRRLAGSPSVMVPTVESPRAVIS